MICHKALAVGKIIECQKERCPLWRRLSDDKFYCIDAVELSHRAFLLGCDVKKHTKKHTKDDEKNQPIEYI